jgi:hypothetical protein
MANALRLTANGGCEYIDNNTERTGKKYYCFIVQADTVVGTLTGGYAGDTTVNYLTSIGLGSKTLKQGAIIYAPGDAVFTNLTLTSGTIIAYAE